MPVTDLTMEQEFKMRQIEDALNKPDSRKEDIVTIKADFSVKLADYNIDIPKIVIYNIAEIIDINVDIKLKKVL